MNSEPVNAYEVSMYSERLAITEQLPLFEDKRVLLNRGILELTRLNLSEAKKAFEDYKDARKKYV